MSTHNPSYSHVFSRPSFAALEEHYLLKALADRRISGDHRFTQRCHEWMEKHFGCTRALLTTSGTHALEMAALLLEIQPGDEVILPSFTFSSTGNAFALRGARLKFIDIRPDTLNLDENRLQEAISAKTRVIVPVHYAGVSCEMDSILEQARQKKIAVVEDAAQAIFSTYKGRSLGTLGEFGCFSFHETKNLTCGEGGALVINDPKYAKRAEIVREKGTNRSQFFRGAVDKYTWLDCGSSFLPSELCAAVLLAQFERAQEIESERAKRWRAYATGLGELGASGRIQLPTPPAECVHNHHLFGIRVSGLEERTRLIAHLKSLGVGAAFHYVPLHLSPAGRKYGDFVGREFYTTRESERLVRLPLWPEMPMDQVEFVIDSVTSFFNQDSQTAPWVYPAPFETSTPSPTVPL